MWQDLLHSDGHLREERLPCSPQYARRWNGGSGKGGYHKRKPKVSFGQKQGASICPPIFVKGELHGSMMATNEEPEKLAGVEPEV